MPEPGKISLPKVLVGGEPVGFTKSSGTLHLAGADLTLKEWQEIERRINLFYIRAGMITDPKKSKADPNSGTSSFLSANLKQILKREDGIIKDPPWWLKHLYSGVITKESLWRD